MGNKKERRTTGRYDVLCNALVVVAGVQCLR